MEQNSSSQADISSTIKEILLVFWNPKVYFRVQQIPPLVSVQRQTNPVHALQISFFMIDFNPLNAELNPICHLLALLGAHYIFHVSVLGVNILLPSTPMSSRSSCFPTKTLYALLPSSLHCTFPHHIIQDTNSYYKETQSSRLHPDTYLRLRFIRDLYSI